MSTLFWVYFPRLIRLQSKDTSDRIHISHLTTPKIMLTLITYYSKQKLVSVYKEQNLHQINTNPQTNWVNCHLKISIHSFSFPENLE